MNPPRPREKHVQAMILQYLRLRAAWAERFNSAAFKVEGRFVRANSAPGCSDILACYRGRFLALEVKRDAKAKATSQQEQFLGAVRRAKGLASVVWSVEQVKLILDAIDHEEGEETP